MRKIIKVVAVAGLFLVPVTHATERVEHFEGEPAENLEQAVANLSEYNDKLAAIIDNGDLSDADHARIHELTYTLESALARIKEEIDVMAEDLEAVHLASEQRATDVVIDKAPAYLSAVRTLVE